MAADSLPNNSSAYKARPEQGPKPAAARALHGIQKFVPCASKDLHAEFPSHCVTYCYANKVQLLLTVGPPKATQVSKRCRP
jgi:hypothetical protein